MYTIAIALGASVIVTGKGKKRGKEVGGKLSSCVHGIEKMEFDGSKMKAEN